MTAPSVLAEPGEPAEPGLTEACMSATSTRPCRFLGVIPDTEVTSNTTQEWSDGKWLVEGTIHVHSGGTAIVSDATLEFLNTSGGILVDAGGTLVVERSALLENETGGSAFVLDVAAGSAFTLNLTRVRGGEGLVVAANATEMSGNVLEQIPLALRLVDVAVTIHHNEFVDNLVAVNQTGGQPRLEANRFEGGEYCVRDWRTNPSIVGNVFRGCHVGILHQESHSDITGNDMEDRGDPPGVGMLIDGTLSPVIENNRITNYGTGILVTNARAYVRNNSIFGNVGDGVRVVRNSGVMDIQGNDIHSNGGRGIALLDVEDVVVFGNSVHHNGGDGVVVDRAGGVTLDLLNVSSNGGTGVRLDDAPGVLLQRSRVAGHPADGIVVGAGSAGATLLANDATGNGGSGVVIRANGTRLDGGSADGNGDAGVRIPLALDVRLGNATANGNGGDGVRFEGGQALVHRVEASRNGANGFSFHPGELPWQLLRRTELVNVRAFDNAHAGLLTMLGNAVVARQSWWEGNAFAGVENRDQVAPVDAAECYWGSPNGPTAVDNPGGDGDRAVGLVSYRPFLTSPPA